MTTKRKQLTQVDAPIRKYRGKTLYLQDFYPTKLIAEQQGKLGVDYDKAVGKESTYKVFKSPKQGYALYMR